jgi:two-component system, NtrC family, response regulator AtoC
MKAGEDKCAPIPEEVPPSIDEGKADVTRQDEVFGTPLSELKASGDLYARRFESAPAGYISLDPQGMVEEINLAGAALLEIDKHDLVGKPFASCVRPEQSDAFLSYLSLVSESSTPHAGQFVMRSGNDVDFPALLYSTGDRDAAGTLLHVRITLVPAPCPPPSGPRLQQRGVPIQALLEAVDGAACLLDRDGKILALNRAMAERLGSAPEALIGKAVCDSFPDDLAAKRSALIDKVVREGKPCRCEDTLAGTVLDNNLYPIFGKTGEVEAIAAFSQDVTKKRETERALRLSDARFRETYDNSPVMMHSINRDGVLLSVNKKWLEVMGYTREEVIGRKLDLIMTRESWEWCFSSVLPKFWPEGKCSDVPYQYVKKDGTIIDVLLDSRVMDDPEWGLMSLSVIRDVTDRKRAEKALRRSEERFRAIFEGVRDCIFIKDRLLRFSHVNPAMETLLGRSAEEVIGLTAADLYGEDAGRHIREVDLRVLNGESVEEEHTRPVNEVKLTFHDIMAPLRSGTGEIVGICGISRNITERKRIEAGSSIALSDYQSLAMRETMAKGAFAAASDSIILLLGESGSGKDYLARWIHAHSRRCDGPFFAVNCAAVPHDLAESELFGHEAGAFTGARGRKRGLLELAEGGTLLLNEIGELSMALQSKLLTFLDTKSFVRVGGEKSVHVNARLIAATHRDLESEAERGRFLKPLFYRLNVFVIELPPLRRRMEDIPLLVEEIMSRLAGEMQLTEVPAFDASALDELCRYQWPGNVRELRNVLERSVMLSGEKPMHVALPLAGIEQAEWSHRVSFPEGRSLHGVVDEVIFSVCEEALRRSGGSRNAAARLLGVSRDSLYRYLKRAQEERENPSEPVPV